MPSRCLFLFTREKGFTILEVLVGLTIISLALTSLVPLYALSAKVLSTGSDKLVAANLANRDLEKIRSMDYDSVGIVAGNPTGTLDPDYDVSVNGKSFHIKTRVSWEDAEFDSYYPTDLDPRDYKRVIITVSWAGTLPDQEVRVSTLVSRESEEKVAVGGSIEAVAKDNNGNLLQDVKIQITTGASSPMSDWTDANGKVIFYMLTPSLAEGDYTVTASKTGWTVRPDDLSQTCTVLANQTRSLEFVLGQPGDLIVHLKDPNGNVINKNAKIRLTSTEVGTSEYTSSNGEFNVTGLFPGGYDLTAWAAAYDECGPTPVSIVSGQTAEVSLTLVPTPTGQLHLTVCDQGSGSPISAAQVKMSQTTGFESLGSTNSNGIYQGSFEAGSYTLEVIKTGYLTSTQTVSIVASQNTTLTIYLQTAPSYGSILVRCQTSGGDPRNDVRVRVRRSDYSQEKMTGSYAPGEALFDNLAPGAYTVERYRSGWRDSRSVAVVAGQRETVVYTIW